MMGMKRNYVLSVFVMVLLLASFSARESGYGNEEYTKPEDTLGWKYGAELSYIATSGNSESRTGSIKADIKRKAERTTVRLRAGGLYGEGKDEVEASSYFANFKFDWYFAKKTYAFGLLGIEGDEFAGYWSRQIIRTGLGQEFIKTRKNELNGEIGAEYIYEDFVSDQIDDGEIYSLVTYINYTHMFTDTLSFVQEIEYLPEFEDFDNYRVNSTTSLLVNLAKYLVLKTGLEIKYDSRDLLSDDGEELENTDTKFSTSIIVLF